VALALVPEAVAFAFVAGVHPLVGLYAAFIVGLITAVLGGRPGMISGATGALAVVMVSLVAQHGVEYLFATVVLMGLIQIVVGIMKWGKFIRLVPHPVMLGFVNGLAIVIFLAQLGQFQVPGTAEASGHGMASGEWLSGMPMYLMLALVAVTMAIIWVWPRVTNVIPAPLAGIGIVAAIVIGFGLDVPRVGDLASIEGGLPMFHIPVVPATMETFWIILPYALILSAIGLIESLLTLNLVGEMTNKRGGASQECIAQGLSNTVTGFFGGMGGCAMIGQSMINVKSGGRTRIAGIAAALFLLAFILFASGLIEQIPLAALVGVMFMVVIGTFAWNSLRILRKVPRPIRGTTRPASRRKSTKRLKAQRFMACRGRFSLAPLKGLRSCLTSPMTRHWSSSISLTVVLWISPHFKPSKGLPRNMRRWARKFSCVT